MGIGLAPQREKRNLLGRKFGCATNNKWSRGDAGGWLKFKFSDRTSAAHKSFQDRRRANEALGDWSRENRHG
jgi:hypothetical protein